MTKMKDSGIDWIGEIPEDWGVVRLKDCVVINNGKDYKEVEVLEEGFPVIGSGGLFAYASHYLYDGVAVLLGRKGTIDKPLYVEGKFWTVDTMFYCIPKKTVNAKFIYYIALQIPFDLYSTNTALPSMTQSDLQNHHFILPSLLEQTKIADYLDKKVAQLDRLKSLLEEQITTLQDYRKSLIYEIVTKGLDKTAPLKDSGVDWIGEISEGWGVKRLKDIFEIIGSGMTPDSSKENYYDGGINWLQSGDLYKTDYVETVSKTITDLGYRSSATLKIYEAPFIALAMYGASIGNLAISKIDACVNQAVVVLKDDEQRVRFAKYALECSREELIFAAQGGTQPNINQVLIKNWQIPLPYEEETKKIADFLDNKTKQINKLIAIKQEQIDNINQQRQTLIYDVVTGKRRV